MPDAKPSDFVFNIFPFAGEFECRWSNRFELRANGICSVPVLIILLSCVRRIRADAFDIELVGRRSSFG